MLLFILYLTNSFDFLDNNSLVIKIILDHRNIIEIEQFSQLLLLF